MDIDVQIEECVIKNVCRLKLVCFINQVDCAIILLINTN